MSEIETLPPRSRLHEWCDGLIESTWLAAAGILPFILNPAGVTNAHEAPKMAFVRVLAVLGLAAVFVRTLEQRPDLGGVWRRAARLARTDKTCWLFGLLALLQVLSNVLSLDPSTSLWGSPEIFQGSLAWASEGVLVALVALHLRTRAQLERLAGMLLLAGTVVSLCGLAQWMGWDPAQPAGGRISGTMGNPIYLANYLLACIPLAVAKFLQPPVPSVPKTGKRHTPGGRFFWGLMLLPQLLAFLGAQSRGAILGLLCGAFALGVLVALLRGWRRLRGVFLALSVGAVVVGGLLPLGLKAGLLGERGDANRLTLWRQAAGIVLPGLRSQGAGSGVFSDPLAGLRPWIGHGQETLPGVFVQHASFTHDLSQESWFHSLVWDHAYAFGLPSALILVGLFLCLLEKAFVWLGLIPTPGARRQFWLLTTGLALLGGCVVPLLLRSPGLAGIGILFGTVGGGLVHLLWRLFAEEDFHAPHPPALWLLVAGTTAGMMACLVGLALAFPTAAVSTLLCVQTGVLLAVCHRPCLSRDFSDAPANAPGAKVKNVRTHEPTSSLWQGALLATGPLLALLYHTVGQEARHPPASSLLGFLADALWQLDSHRGTVSALLIPVMACCCLGVLVFERTEDSGGQASSRPATPGRMLKPLALAGGFGLLTTMLLALWNVHHNPAPGANPSLAGVLMHTRGMEQQYLAFMLLLVMVVIATGCHLSRQGGTTPAHAARGWLALGLAVPAGGALMWHVAFLPLTADIAVQQALSCQLQKRPHALEAALFREAVSLNPRPFMYRSMFSEAMIGQAGQTAGGAATRLLDEAVQVLEAGRRDMSLNRKDYYLGRTQLHQALLEPEPRRTELGRQAARHFQTACALEPYTETIWSEAALVDELLLHDTKAAMNRRAHARELASEAWLTHAEFQFQRSLSCSNAEIKTRLLSTALEYFDAATQSPDVTPVHKARAHIGRALLLLGAHRAREAVPVLEQAVKAQLPFDTWEVEMVLAEGWLQLSDRAQARSHLQKSLAVVPPDKRRTLLPLQRELEKSR